MNIKIQFTDSMDRQSKITANSDKFLIEEQYITEGNFLIFSSSQRFEDQINDMKKTIDMLLLKQEGII